MLTDAIGAREMRRTMVRDRQEIATKAEFGFVDIVSAFCQRQERAVSVAECSRRITKIASGAWERNVEIEELIVDADCLGKRENINSRRKTIVNLSWFPMSAD